MVKTYKIEDIKKELDNAVKKRSGALKLGINDKLFYIGSDGYSLADLDKAVKDNDPKIMDILQKGLDMLNKVIRK